MGAPIICFFPFTPVFWEDTYTDYTGGEWYCVYGPLNYRPPGDVLGSPTPPPPEFTYYAGRCMQKLGGIYEKGPVRHDDVAGVKRNRDDEIVEEWASGFFPVSVWRATWKTNCPRNELTGEPECIYVAGYVKHRSTAEPCRKSLPKVDKGRYDTINSRRYLTNWTDYHLLRRNCQDWASEVLR